MYDAERFTTGRIGINAPCIQFIEVSFCNGPESAVSKQFLLNPFTMMNSTCKSMMSVYELRNTGHKV